MVDQLGIKEKRELTLETEISDERIQSSNESVKELQFDVKPSPRSKANVPLTIDKATLESAWTEMMSNIGIDEEAPCFNENWWPSSSVAPPTHSDILRVVSLAGIRSISMRDTQDREANTGLGQPRLQARLLLQKYNQALDQACGTNKDQSCIRMARNLCWRVLNLRIKLRREHRCALGTKAISSDSDLVLLVFIMTIKALDTLRKLTSEGLLEWQTDENNELRRTLLIENLDVQDSAIVVPTLSNITSKELWVLFTEFADELNYSNEENSCNQLDDTSPLLISLLRATGRSEYNAKLALVSSWLELIQSVVPTDQRRLIPYTNCLYGLVRWIDNIAVPSKCVLNHVECVVTLAECIADHLNSTILKVTGGSKLPPAFIVDYRPILSVALERGLLNLISKCLWHARLMDTPQALDRSRPWQSPRYRSAAVALCNFLALTFRVHLKLIPNDPSISIADVHNSQKRRSMAACPSFLNSARLSEHDATRLVTGLINLAAKAIDDDDWIINGEQRCVKQAIIALIIAGLASVRTRVEKRAVLMSLTSRLKDLCRIIPSHSTEVREELANWPLQSASSEITKQTRKLSEQINEREKLTLPKILLTIFLSIIVLTMYYIQMTWFDGHWMYWLPDMEENVF